MNYLLCLEITLLLFSCDFHKSNDQPQNHVHIDKDTCIIDLETKDLLMKASTDTHLFLEKLKQKPSTVYVINRPILEYLSISRRDLFQQELIQFANDTAECAQVYSCLQLNRISTSTVGAEVRKILKEN